MTDNTVIRQQLELMFNHTGADVDSADELYHDDAVLEFPQSGERFEGRASFTAWRSQYPVDANDMRYRLQRIIIHDDFSAVELTASYNAGQTWMCGVQLLDWRDGKITLERIYVCEPWEPPTWRAPWRASTPAGTVTDPTRENA